MISQTKSRHKQKKRNIPDKLVHVPALLRDLPGDLIGANRIVIRLFPEPEIVAQIYEGHRNTKPHAQQSQHCSKRHLHAEMAQKEAHENISASACKRDFLSKENTYSTRRVLSPDKTVQHKTDAKDNSRVQHRSL